MKKIIGVIACGLFLNAAAASSQVTDKEKVQMEKRIEKLIKKMTLEEKVGLLHGNSKFYVAGVERLAALESTELDWPSVKGNGSVRLPFKSSHSDSAFSIENKPLT